MSVIASQITSLTIVYSTVYPVTRKMFPFDDVIMLQRYTTASYFKWNKCGGYFRPVIIFVITLML